MLDFVVGVLKLELIITPKRNMWHTDTSKKQTLAFNLSFIHKLCEQALTKYEYVFIRLRPSPPQVAYVKCFDTNVNSRTNSYLSEIPASRYYFKHFGEM